MNQVKFVDKNNLEAQNPRSDNGIPTVSAGLAMDSPLFDYVVVYFLLKLHLAEEICVALNKCTYYQSGTQSLIKTLFYQRLIDMNDMHCA